MKTSTAVVIAFGLLTTVNPAVGADPRVRPGADTWVGPYIDSQAQAQTLKITLLGTGSPRPLLTRFGPSTLVEAGSQKLLIDCGRGATQRLFQQLNIPLSQITSVFITHLHSDHIIGLPDLWLSGWLATPFGRRVEPLEVYGPAGTREAMSHFEKAFQVDIRSRIEDEKLRPGAAW